MMCPCFRVVVSALKAINIGNSKIAFRVDSMTQIEGVSEEVQLGYVDKVRLFGKDARLFIISNATASFAFGISNVIFNLYMVEAGFSEDFLGFFLSISMFATAGIAILAGMLVDRRARKPIIFIASTIAFVALVIQYTTLNPTYLLLSQVMMGLVSAFNQVSWMPFITDLSSEEERAHLFGFSGGISLLSVLCGNLIGGYLPRVLLTMFGITSLFVAYQLTLWVSLAPQVISLLALVPMTRDKPSPSKFRIGFSNVTNRGFIAKYSSAVMTVGLGAGMIVLFFNIFFAQEFAADSALIGVIFGINTLVLAAGNFAAPALADRIGKVRTVVITEAFSIPFLLMISWAPYLYIAVIAYVMRTALMNMAGPVSGAFFMEGLAKEERATAMGVVRTFDSFVRGVAANIGGGLLAAGFYRVPYILVSGLYVASVIMFYIFFKTKEKELDRLRKMEVVVEPSEEERIEAT